HIRSEDRWFWPAIDEILAIAREARLPVQISHAKLAMKGLWGRADSLLRVLDAARASGLTVTADVYPYTYWQSTLTVLFPKRDFDNRVEAERVLREIAAPEGLLLGRFRPDSSYVGKTVAEIAHLRRTDPATTLMGLIRESLDYARRTEEEDVESVIGTSMDEGDVARILTWPWANFCSDGELAGRHPRGFGTFPRILGRYVREQRVMPLEEAVRKASSLATTNVGLRRRGLLLPGYFADLVLFDPAIVIDRATPTSPPASPSGTLRAWVNGPRVSPAARPSG